MKFMSIIENDDLVSSSNNVKHGKRKYKQMSLEVAVRNPERYLQLLRIFNEFDGKDLNDAGILDIYTSLYLKGFLNFNGQSTDELTKTEILSKIVNEIRHNNEWGYPTGYQAAFTRYLKTLSEFGFIYAQYNQPLKISEIGKALCEGKLSLSDAFAVQSLRFWRKSPYRRVLNDFNYFDFIYNVLIALKQAGKKLSYTQFMLSLFSDNGDVKEFLDTISKNKFGTDMDLAYQFVMDNYSEVDDLHAKAAKQQSCFGDYGNTVFRVLQLTGFINVEYSGTILISLNTNRIDFLRELKSLGFELDESEKEDEYSYFIKIGSYFKELENIVEKYKEKLDYSTTEYNKKLPGIVSSYGLTKEVVAQNLLDVSNGQKSRGDAFWYMQAPLKFEFLLTLFIYLCNGDNFEYRPNYKCDDYGIPYSHAPGNVGDIEVFNESTYWLIEATLIRNKTQQLNNETINLIRHINANAKGVKYLELVAPYIHEDTDLMLRTASLVAMIDKKGKFYSRAVSTEDFINLAKKNKELENIKKYTESTFAHIKQLLQDYEEYLNSESINSNS